MIAQNLNLKLEGATYEAVRSSALRTGASTTKEAIRTIIKETPEYQAIHSIHANAQPSVAISNPNRLLTSSQEENHGN